MDREILAHLSDIGLVKVLFYGLVLAILFELITCGFRFGLDMQSTRDTAHVGTFTLGVRIHHGYIGLLLMLLAPLFFREYAWIFNTLMIVGIGLFVSDMIHHFLILWPLTGSHDFDLVYPRLAESPVE